MATDPNFANVEILTDFDGTLGSTHAWDQSTKGHALLFQGNAKIDTSQFKFGTASLYLDGTTDWVETPDDASLELGSGDFTLEGHFRFETVKASDQHLIGKWRDGSSEKSYAIVHTGSGTNLLELRLSSDSSTTTTKISASWTPTVDTWYHVAADWDGTTYRLYVDGSVLGTGTTVVALADDVAGFSIGGEEADGAKPFNGWVDEPRLTVGVSRYGGAFTAPTAAYPRPEEARAYKGTTYVVYSPFSDLGPVTYKGASYVVYYPVPKRYTMINCM